MRGRRGTNDATGQIARTALLAGLIAGMLTCGVALVAGARGLDLGPKVGDILVFRQGARMPSDWEFAATTAATPSATCRLCPEAMASGGGSLVVEQRFDAPRRFQVHWAGVRTSEGATDCGAIADLILPHADLQLLSNAVGGAGVEHRMFSGL